MLPQLAALRSLACRVPDGAVASGAGGSRGAVRLGMLPVTAQTADRTDHACATLARPSSSAASPQQSTRRDGTNYSHSFVSDGKKIWLQMEPSTESSRRAL